VIYKPFSDYATINIFTDGAEQLQVDMKLNVFFGVLLNKDPFYISVFQHFGSFSNRLFLALFFG